MRYIKQIERCKEFDDHIDNSSISTKWDLPTDVKTALHNHLLKQQQGLCIYCEQKIFPKGKEGQYLPKSMIEHVRPKDRDKYPELTYILCNLAVACRATEEKPKDVYCEDNKKNLYDENNFLNPLEKVDVEDYFEYDAEGKIHPKNNNTKAKYMIEKILNLDCTTLQNMRKEIYSIYINMPLADVETILRDDKNESLPPFYSMLKQLFMI